MNLAACSCGVPRTSPSRLKPGVRLASSTYWTRPIGDIRRPKLVATKPPLTPMQRLIEDEWTPSPPRPRAGRSCNYLQRHAARLIAHTEASIGAKPPAAYQG